MRAERLDHSFVMHEELSVKRHPAALDICQTPVPEPIGCHDTTSHARSARFSNAGVAVRSG
jgi:hypothetical protein